MLDSERVSHEVWSLALQRRGYQFPQELHRSLIGLREDDSERRLSAHFGPDFPYAAIRDEARVLWRERSAADAVPYKPGLLELLEYLESERLPIAVASSTLRARALPRLGALATRFDALAFGDEVLSGKPAPDVYLLAAQRLDVPAGDCLALEDSPPGVAAATAAGMTVIMIPDLVPPPAPPRYLCRSLVEVTRWLHGNASAER